MANPQTASSGIQYLSPNDVQSPLRKLVAELREWMEKGNTIDGFIIIARGGLGVGVVLCEAFPDLRVELITCRKYDGERLLWENGKVVIESTPREESIRGKTWALVDDVRQDGHTFAKVTQWVESVGGTVALRIALIVKRNSDGTNLTDEQIIREMLIRGMWFPYEDYASLPWEPCSLNKE